MATSRSRAVSSPSPAAGEPRRRPGRGGCRPRRAASPATGPGRRGRRGRRTTASSRRPSGERGSGPAPGRAGRAGRRPRSRSGASRAAASWAAASSWRLLQGGHQAVGHGRRTTPGSTRSRQLSTSSGARAASPARSSASRRSTMAAGSTWKPWSGVCSMTSVEPAADLERSSRPWLATTRARLRNMVLVVQSVVRFGGGHRGRGGVDAALLDGEQTLEHVAARPAGAVHRPAASPRPSRRASARSPSTMANSASRRR